MAFLKRRILETFLTEILISLLFAALINTDSIEIISSVTISFTAFSFLLFFAFYAYFLMCHLANVRDLIVFLKTNLAVQLVFMVINLIFVFLNFETAYTYLFLPYKAGMHLGLEKLESAFYTNLIIFVLILFVPFLQTPE